MNRLPRPLAALAALGLFAICGAAVAAQPADDITLVTTTLPALNPGQTAWVSTLWRGASEDATSFELTVVQPIPKGITVSYPENTGSHSSLYKQSTLLAGDTDYSSIKLQVGDAVLGERADQAERRIPACREEAEAEGGRHPAGRRGHRPDRRAADAHRRPDQGRFRRMGRRQLQGKQAGRDRRPADRDPPAGATVSYPNDGSSSGFAADSTLSVGETDHASFKLDTGTLAPGSYEVELDLIYGNGAASPRNRHRDRELMRRLLVIGVLAAVASGCGSLAVGLARPGGGDRVRRRAGAGALRRAVDGVPDPGGATGRVRAGTAGLGPDSGRVRRGPDCGRRGPGAARARQRPRRRSSAADGTLRALRSLDAGVRQGGGMDTNVSVLLVRHADTMSTT